MTQTLIPPAAPPSAPVSPPPGQGDGGRVPVAALLEERERRRTESARARAAEEALAALQAQHLMAGAHPSEAAPAIPVPAPSAAEQMAETLRAANLQTSRRFAEKTHGRETAARLHDWAFERCERDPAFNARMRSADDPYDAAWQAWSRENAAAAQRPAPRSLAGLPGAAGGGLPYTPTGPGEAFGGLFRR